MDNSLGLFVANALRPFSRCFDFQGRSTRTEYLSFTLVTVLVMFLLGVASTLRTIAHDGEEVSGFGVVILLVFVGFVLPTLVATLSVMVRRLHDQNSPGWMLLMWFIPVVGHIVVFAFMLMRGVEGPNRYGPDPRDC